MVKQNLISNVCLTFSDASTVRKPLRARNTWLIMLESTRGRHLTGKGIQKLDWKSWSPNHVLWSFSYKNKYGRVQQNFTLFCILGKNTISGWKIAKILKNFYRCDICKKSFTRKEHFMNHVMWHTGETPHHCQVCGKKYTRKEHLANHMRSHTNDTPFRCEICGKFETFKLKFFISIKF